MIAVPLSSTIASLRPARRAGAATVIGLLPPCDGGGVPHQTVQETIAGIADAVASGFGVPAHLLGHDRISLFPSVFPNFSAPTKSLKQCKINRKNCIDGVSS